MNCDPEEIRTIPEGDMPITVSILASYLENFKKDILDDTRKRIDDLQLSLDKSQQVARDTKELVKECRDECGELTLEMDQLKRENTRLKQRLKTSDEKLRVLENYSRKMNLIIDGVPDKKGRDRSRITGKNMRFLKDIRM